MSEHRNRVYFSVSNPRHTVNIMATEIRPGHYDVRCSVDGLLRGELSIEDWVGLRIALGDDAALVWGQRFYNLLPYATDTILRFEHDEPIWAAFQRRELWILVCEISVVIFDPARQAMIAFFGLPDIPNRIWWEGDTLHVRDFNGLLHRFAWDDDRRNLFRVTGAGSDTWRPE